MTTKESIMKALNELADDATIEEAMEKLLFLYKINEGIEQADRGQTVSNEDAKKRIEKWLK